MDILEYFDEEYFNFTKSTDALSDLFVHAKDIFSIFNTIEKDIIKMLLNRKFEYDSVEKNLQDLEKIISSIRSLMDTSKNIHFKEKDF